MLHSSPSGDILRADPPLPSCPFPPPCSSLLVIAPPGIPTISPNAEQSAGIKFSGQRRWCTALISQVWHYKEVVSALELSKNWVIFLLKRHFCSAKISHNCARVRHAHCEIWSYYNKIPVNNKAGCHPSLGGWHLRLPVPPSPSAGKPRSTSDLWKVAQGRISFCIPTAHRRFHFKNGARQIRGKSQ